MADVDRYRDALEKITRRWLNSHESYRSDRNWPTEHAKNWHDGFVTGLATASIIAREALDPEGTAAYDDAMGGTDREWFELTGNCGHCGNPAEDCWCTDDDPCECGPHELRTQDIECVHCKGTGINRARPKAEV